jgi:hypothetical protein
MRFTMFTLAVLLAACSATTESSTSVSTEPNAIEPSILITNVSDETGPVIWTSDSGSDTVRVAPCAGQVCTS